MIRILTVMDNQTSDHKALKAQHGLSFYIQKDNTKLLFDFGSGPEMWENGKRLHVPFEQIDYAVFSHSHYDHSGGFLWVDGSGLDAAAVYGREDSFFQGKYARREEHRGKKLYTYLGCGFSKEYVISHTRQQLVCEDCFLLAEGCWAVGNFERSTDFETIPARYVREEESGVEGGSPAGVGAEDGRLTGAEAEDGSPAAGAKSRMIPDGFEDEICLALELDGGEGLAVVVGCSHPGIINMLRTVEARLQKPVKAVIGGIHLSKADDHRIFRTVQAFRELGVEFVALNHCSGDRIDRELEVQKLENCRLRVGDCLYL